MYRPAILLQITPPAAAQEGKSVLHLFFSSDPVVMVTLGILVIFSVVSWAIIFYKYGQVKKARNSSEKFLEVFDKSQPLEEMLTKPAPRDGNPLYQIFAEGIADIV